VTPRAPYKPSSSPVTVTSPTDSDVIDPEMALSSTLLTSSRVRQQPQVPSDVDDDDFGSAPVSVAFAAVDDILSDELHSKTETFTPDGLQSPAWAALVTGAATSIHSSSLVRPSALSRDTDNAVAVPLVLLPRTAASANFTHSGLAESRENSVTSVISGDTDVQVRQGLSKKPALSSGLPTSGRTDLARVTSNTAEQYYI
jgi:hypothetical protein